jgi:hypothetical protein
MVSIFWELHGVLFIDFVIKQRIINVAYNLKFLKGREKSPFPSERRRLLAKSVCRLYDKARPFTAAVTRGTLENMHWGTCSLDLA